MSVDGGVTRSKVRKMRWQMDGECRGGENLITPSDQADDRAAASCWIHNPTMEHRRTLEE